MFMRLCHLDLLSKCQCKIKLMRCIHMRSILLKILACLGNPAPNYIRESRSTYICVCSICKKDSVTNIMRITSPQSTTFIPRSEDQMAVFGKTNDLSVLFERTWVPVKKGKVHWIRSAISVCCATYWFISCAPKTFVLPNTWRPNVIMVLTKGSWMWQASVERNFSFSTASLLSAWSALKIYAPERALPPDVPILSIVPRLHMTEAQFHPKEVIVILEWLYS